VSGAATTKEGLTVAKSKKQQKTRRGFASMTPGQRRALASRGSKASQAKAAGHQFTPEERRKGSHKGAPKGGSARRENRPGGRLAPPRPVQGRKPGEKRGRWADLAKQAEAVRLRAEGLTLAEIGRQLGVVKQTVHTMLARARWAAEAQGQRDGAGGA
jgi:hypothetical protein